MFLIHSIEYQHNLMFLFTNIAINPAANPMIKAAINALVELLKLTIVI
jgi:hypothetical protein